MRTHFRREIKVDNDKQTACLQTLEINISVYVNINRENEKENENCKQNAVIKRKNNKNKFIHFRLKCEKKILFNLNHLINIALL